MAKLGLFARPSQTEGRGSLLAFASSDRSECCRGNERAEVAYAVIASLQTTVLEHCGLFAVPVVTTGRVYGAMQFYVFRLVERLEAAAPPHGR